MGKNGNDSSRVRQFSVVCVNTLHEKYFLVDIVDAFGDTTVSSLTVPTGSQFSNIVSKSVTLIVPELLASIKLMFSIIVERGDPGLTVWGPSAASVVPASATVC